MNPELLSNPKFCPIKIWEVVCRYMEGLCVGNINKEGVDVCRNSGELLKRTV